MKTTELRLHRLHVATGDLRAGSGWDINPRGRVISLGCCAGARVRCGLTVILAGLSDAVAFLVIEARHGRWPGLGAADDGKRKRSSDGRSRENRCFDDQAPMVRRRTFETLASHRSIRDHG